MAEFVLQQKISSTTIGTKCVSCYAHILMSKFETNFIQIPQNKSFLFGKLKTFLEDLNSFYPSLKFTHESRKVSSPFLD